MGYESLHQEFADSANDGPWGAALVTEFIPQTEAHFRTLGTSARFLYGHSSGGWSVLWLQVNYPDVFAGAWAAAPDPVDFHDFFGPDITKPGQNFYRDAGGNEYGFCRDGARDASTIRDFVNDVSSCGLRRPALLAPGEAPWPQRQMDSYDEVFSPRNADGTPSRLFNRKSGTIDSNVAAYWEEHYDITHILQQHWSELGPLLQGKLHVFVGGADTFHLDGPISLMAAALHQLGSDAEIQIVPHDDHWEILDWNPGRIPGGLVSYALSEMAARLRSAPRDPGATSSQNRCTSRSG